jgi:23S rRNA (cytosine1962-C5)-methyltransferase
MPGIPTYPTLRLKPKRERSVIHRHPWLFTGAFHSELNSPKLTDGAVVEVQTSSGEPLAWGHLNLKGALAIRLFAFVNEIQAGTVAIFDERFWVGRFDAALRFRRQFFTSTDTTAPTTAYRLINAEGDRLPGLIVDVYAETAVVQVRTIGMQAVLPVLNGWLAQHGWINVWAQTDEKTTGSWLAGAPQPVVRFQEYGLWFEASPEKGQKTGFFLDQRENRLLLRQVSSGRRVLNAFSYTGGFGVYAQAGGATSVVSVDISASACAGAERNAALNFGFDQTVHRSQVADVFDLLKKLPQGSFDLIVLDPPAFTKHVSTINQATRGYKEINLKALRALPSGGQLFTFSCSQHISPDLFRKVVFGAAADARRPVRLIRTLGHAPDHPIDLYHPEGEYLKGLWLEVE